MKLQSTRDIFGQFAGSSLRRALMSVKRINWSSIVRRPRHCQDGTYNSSRHAMRGSTLKTYKYTSTIVGWCFARLFDYLRHLNGR